MKIPEYNEILKRCLDKIPDDIDKREGSVIFLALAPICYELSNMYFELSNTYSLFNFETTSGHNLDILVNQFGIYRKKATKAIRLCEFFDYDNNYIEVPLNSKFFDGEIFYTVTEKTQNSKFLLTCEKAGTCGNKFFGHIDTCQYIHDLHISNLCDIVVPAFDDETDYELKQRFKFRINNKRFGGNITDYKDFICNIDYVNGVRIVPNFNGAGTVLAIVVGENYKSIKEDFLQKIQQQVDPLDNRGNGFGIAPIGHTVTIKTAVEQKINIKTDIVYKNDWNFNKMQKYICDIIDSYLLEIRKNFMLTNTLVVRISQIESRLLNLDGILDISNTSINGKNKNFLLEDDKIPIRGDFVDSI